MTTIPYTADTIFRWSMGREEIVAHAVGAIALGGRSRAVLMDSCERHWLAQITEDGKIIEIMAGPVTGEEALHAAELVVSGIRDHGSATRLVNILALGLVARICNEGRHA